MVTWEFPPRIVGGIARHCEGLAKALVRGGHEVHVITLDLPGIPYTAEMEGVKVYRTAVQLGHPDFLTWALLFNHFMEKKMAEVNQKVEFDIIHVHDWLTAFAGISFKHYLKKPMITTIHATEVGRAQGLHNPSSLAIDGVEWWSTYEASKVIVTSNSMRSEVCNHFQLPWEKIEIIPNGIDLDKYGVSVDRRLVRERYGVGYNEKLVLCVGRLVPQKGIEYLIRAIPMVNQRFPATKFIIVGDGWLRGHLESLAQSTGHTKNMAFTGFIPDEEVLALMTSADVLVVPSIYEPFGIVALEGMAAGAPVVASQIGGLGEVIEHDRTGIFVHPRNPDSIAWGIDRILSDPDHSTWLAQNAKELVQKTYSWDAIATKTVEVYERVTG